MKARTLVLLIPVALLVACGRTEPVPPPPADTAPTTAAAPEPTASAQASLAGASGSKVSGELQFSAGEGGVSVTGNLTGLAASTVHGFHIHETGDCSAPDAKSAGGHFNPAHVDHGGPSSATRHLGDIPNVEADAQGNATVSATIDGATLRDGGANDLLGKAVIVHAKRDDYTTQPSGDSGDRIACGVVK